MHHLRADELTEGVPHDITLLLRVDILVLPPPDAFSPFSGAASD
jgi:hypothetical protein